ncbi:disease resistance protein RGA2-like isoform X2 [Typha angustifolia]|uniref:disease resistance protein RGA2-like isoform X2 n=1 Tax=Typha angustifolia TaxID=59011 RepID=UPI003C2EF93A
MAELTVVGWLVSPIIKEMVSKARSYLENQYNWSSDMKNDLKSLETNMVKILAVVSAAERCQITDTNQAALLHLMQEAVFQAEDVMDEFDYLLLKAKDERKSKARRFKSFLRDAVKRLLDLDTFRENLTRICKSLETVDSCAKRFLEVAQVEKNHVQQTNSMQWRLTSSFSSEATFIGRSKERDVIVKALLEPVNIKAESSSKSAGAPIILPIVGDGGVGKTTLAQHIYNDIRITAKFDIKMWVCVSDNFDVFRLSKEILEASKSKAVVNLNLDMLQDELKRQLADEKFLLVLDDVWNDPKANKSENYDWWMKLLGPLRNGKSRSAILVTTRIGSMAEMLLASDPCRRERKPCYLQGLETNESWLLFKTHAFPSESIYIPHMEDLKSIGMEIVEKLKGSPLALRVVGRQLNGNYDVEEWKKVSRSALSDDIMKVLKLSYERLPEYLQRCFAYCSLFPRDWPLERDYLVHMWIAQGLIYPQEENNVTMEDIGRGYFKDLCNKSFFETLERDGKIYYVMHDMMSDLAQSVSGVKYCRIESNDPRKIPPNVRHLSVTIDQAHRLESMVEMKSLRTLIVLERSGARWCSNIAPKDDMFKNLKSVRVLVLTGYCMKQLPEFDGLIHLRYLALPITSETSLDAFYRLYHLQVLVLHNHSCVWPQRVIFPEKMNMLINTQHVYLNGTIGEFHVQKKKGNILGMLKDMDGLHGNIKIKSLENIESKEEACEAQLSNKMHIDYLSLEWSSFDHTSCKDEAEVLDGLQPHQNLCVLTIVGYGGSRSPFWLDINWLCKLQSLNLGSCTGWRELPPLGHLPFLKILRIRSMPAVTRVGSEFFGSGEVKGFPKLEELSFQHMPEWVEWSGLRGTQLFPSLQYLWIIVCPKLMEMPAFSLPLKQKILSISPQSPSVQGLKLHFEGYKYFQVSEANSITYLTIMHPDNLKAIEEIKISFINEPMPAKGFRELISLKKLTIFGSDQLLSSMNRGENISHLFPQSLESLEIKYCNIVSDILSICIQNPTALSTMKICYLKSDLHWTLDLQHLTGLVKLDIRHCSNLTALTGVDALTSLEDLSIKNCPDLLSLPYELIGLRSLKSLEVFVCGEIRSLPEYGLLSLSLKNTSILGCHPILQEQLDNMEGPEFDKFDRFVKLNKDEYTRTIIEKLKTEETPFFFTYEEKVLLSQLLATTLATDGNQTKKELRQMLDGLNYTVAYEQKMMMFMEALESRKLSLATAAGNESEMELIETLITYLSSESNGLEMLITSLSSDSNVIHLENERDSDEKSNSWDSYQMD